MIRPVEIMEVRANDDTREGYRGSALEWKASDPLSYSGSEGDRTLDGLGRAPFTPSRFEGSEGDLCVIVLPDPAKLFSESGPDPSSFIFGD